MKTLLSLVQTTMLYKLQLNERVSTLPTIGFNCETVHFKGLDLTIWYALTQGRT